MGSTTYKAMALLQDDSDFDLDAAATELRKTFRRMAVSREGPRITVSADRWQMHLELETEPYVLEESREIAEVLPGCPRAPEIAVCRRRVTVWSTGPDPDISHFNDYVLALNVLEDFKGVILFDPQSDKLI
jgi:hypothetical protein